MVSAAQSRWQERAMGGRRYVSAVLVVHCTHSVCLSSEAEVAIHVWCSATWQHVKQQSQADRLDDKSGCA